MKRPAVRVIRAGELVAVPWRNGQGETREIARSAGGEDWSWRVSLATSVDDATFSAFPGVDRELVLLRGRGLTLSFDDGQVVELHELDALRFAGERGVVGVPLGGATEQLNLMWVRGKVQAAVRLIRGAHVDVPPGAGGACLIHVCSGTARVEELGTHLGESDSLLVEGGSRDSSLRISDEGVALVARFAFAL